MLPDLTKKTRQRLTALLALNAFDAAATAWGLMLGALTEANPLLAWAWEAHWLLFMIPKLSIPSIFGFYLACKQDHLWARWGLAIGAYAYLAIAVWHFFGAVLL